MAAKRGRSGERPDFDATRISAGPGAQDFVHVDAVDPAFRPLPRRFRAPAASEPTAVWRVAGSHASTHGSASDFHSGILTRDDPSTSFKPAVEASQASAPQSSEHHGRTLVHWRQVILLSVVLGAGIIIGIGATSQMLAPGLSHRVQSLAAAAWGGVDQSYRDFSEQLRAIKQPLTALQPAPTSAKTIAGEDGPSVLSTENAENRSPGQIEATSPSHFVQMPTISDRAVLSMIEESAKADRAKVNAGGSLPEHRAGTSEPASQLSLPPLPAPAGGQLAPKEVWLRQEFEQFLHEQQQASIGPRSKEALFLEFKNLLAHALPRGAAPPSAEKEGMRRIEIWQALDTTNLRELASASSAVIGSVEKGSTFRVIDHSKDGKWLKIETPDGSSGYYWAERARKMR